MAESQSCPTESELRALLDGALPEAESNALVAHLDACADCRQRLESLVGGSDAIPKDAAGVSDSLGGSEALAEAMRRLKGDTADQTKTEVGASIGPPSLAFLSPSANPRHLGRLGEYEILEMIGRGGMGTVLKARDPKLERLVAVKVLNPELASSGAARKRFLREAKSAAAVTHEHVVTIHAVDEASDVPFLVMEYVLGVSLEDRIQRTGHLRVEEILRIGMQAAAGLAAAHDQGLVHRDIKPSNILLENGVERVKITDFGLARVMHEAQTTQTNAVAGTPQYMSPEQARGEPVDHRTDLFSLGCVMYAMCTGRSPFRAETPTGAIHRVCEDVPRPMREINPEVPEWLVAIIDRLLAKNREDRFQSAAEVADLLGEYLAHVQRPSQVALPARPQRAQKPAGGRKWLPAALVASVAVILLGLVAVWLSQKSPQEAGSVAGGPRPRFFHVPIEAHANQFLTEPAVPRSLANTLVELKPGLLDAAGIPIQVGSQYIQLGGAKVPDRPSAVEGIPIERRAAKVHFLHGCAFTQPEHGATVATYTFHYEDGTKEVFPVISGRHVQDWNCPGHIPRPATRASVGWRGSNPAVAKWGAQVVLYACTWENPHPEKAISTIDFDRGPRPLPAPFCVGITCDDDSTLLPEEPGLLEVRIAGFMDADRYSVVVPGQPVGAIMGKKSRHDVLLPAGDHPIEIRDGEHVMREGTIAIKPGGKAYVNVEVNTRLLTLPSAQPHPTAGLTGQTSGIWDVALTPDGAMMATAAGDGTVVLWKSQGSVWTKQATLESASSRIRSVAFSPDGRVLASAATSGALCLWDVGTASLAATLRQDTLEKITEAGVTAVAFSPNGETLVSGNRDGTVDFWNVATREEVGTIQAHSNVVQDMAFSPDGTLLATGAWPESAVKVWNVASKQPKHVLHGHTDPVAGVAFSPDGRTLASASGDSSVKLWSVETGKLLDSLFTPCSLVAVAFSPDGKRLAAGGDLGTLHVWDLTTKRTLHEFLAHWAQIRCVTFGQDGKTLVSASHDNTVRLWSADDLPAPFDADPTRPEPRASFAVSLGWSFWPTFSPDGAILAAVDVFANCRVWNLNDFTPLANFAVRKKGDGQPFGWMCQNSAFFTPDKKSLVTCVTVNERAPEIAMWETKTFKRRGNLGLSAKPAKPTTSEARIAFGTDGKSLFVASPGQSLVSAIDLETAASLWSVPSLHGSPRPTAVSPDGEILAVGTELGRVILLNPATGEEIREPLAHGATSVTAVAFAPQGTSLVSAGPDGVIKLWELSSFQSETLPVVHAEHIMSAGFSPDGALLATIGTVWMSEKTPWEHQGEVCLWDMATKKLLTKFHAHYGSVTSAVFSPDGKSLATTGRDGKINLWDVEELLKHAHHAGSPEQAGSVSGDGRE